MNVRLDKNKHHLKMIHTITTIKSSNSSIVLKIEKVNKVEAAFTCKLDHQLKLQTHSNYYINRHHHIVYQKEENPRLAQRKV